MTQFSKMGIQITLIIKERSIASQFYIGDFQKIRELKNFVPYYIIIIYTELLLFDRILQVLLILLIFHSLNLIILILSSIIYITSILMKKIFDFRFLTDLHILGCPTFSLLLQNVCLSVCDTNFVAVLEQKLMD